MQVPSAALEWAQESFGRCELGDERRTRRLVSLGAQLACHAGESPARACRGDTAANEGAYRLLRNAQVTPRAIAEGGFQATAWLAAQTPGDLLAVEDSTTLSYAHGVAEALGDLGGKADARRRGFIVHSVLMLAADSGRTLGLLEQSRWQREVSARGTRHARAERGYEEKESYKWQVASEQMAERLGETQRRVISVCDREADVYEYLQYKVECEERFVVRASWNRRVTGAQRHLFAALDDAPLRGTQGIQMAQRGGAQGRRARQARVELRAGQVELRAPQGRGWLGKLTVNAVLAVERPPPSGETPLCWQWLTSEPVDTLEAVQRVLRYYALRWRVEDFHKAWKSGAGVEARRMQTADNLERIAVMLAFVGVRLLQLREWLASTPGEGESARAAGECSCAGVLDELEWKVLWVTRHRRAPPAVAPSLKWAYETLAQLGGWLDSKRTGRAGWAVLWAGWFRLQERVDAVRVSEQFLGKTK